MNGARVTWTMLALLAATAVGMAGGAWRLASLLEGKADRAAVESLQRDVAEMKADVRVLRALAERR